MKGRTSPVRMSFFSKVSFLTTMVLIPTQGFSKTTKLEARDHILNMAGCFSVTFQYIEDGIHDAFYAPVLEKAVVTSESPLTLTRSLIIDGVEELHWSDTWTNVGENLWKQTVIGPFGDFRYECEGPFIENQWSCLAPGSAKPRRDRERPYATLNRHNTLQINNKRWVHVQNNQKLKSDGSLFSVEAGWNRYERRPESDCSIAPPSSPQSSELRIKSLPQGDLNGPTAEGRD